MFKHLLVTLIASSGLIAAAQPAAAQGQAPVCGKPSFANRASLKQLPGGNLMAVPVEINGTPKQFLLDIGANPDEISQAAVTELHLQQVDQSKPYDALAEQNTTFQFQAPVFDIKGTATARNYQARVRIASFKFGEVALHDLGFLVSNDAEMGKSKPYDGRLTAAGFHQYDIDLDFGGKALNFLAATGCSDPNQIVTWPHQAVAVIPMTLSNGKIAVPVTVDGHAVDAVLDTGSDHTVMRRGIAERVLGLKADTPDMMPDGDLRDGAGARVYRHTFAQIAFEGVVAGNVPAEIQTNSMVRQARQTPTTGSRLQSSETPREIIPDLALGMDVLHQLHIYAAFGQNKLYVTAAQ